MNGYAAGTTVTAQKTVGEIMGLLGSRGVQKMATFQDEKSYTIGFEYDGIGFRMTLPLPNPESPEFTEYFLKSVRCSRTETEARARYEKELNRRWRAFGLYIKSNLVAVEEGILTLGEAFIGNVILRSGQTISETYSHDLPALASGGRLAQLELPGRSQ